MDRFLVFICTANNALYSFMASKQLSTVCIDIHLNVKPLLLTTYWSLGLLNV